MADWKDLARELHSWRDAGRVATFWWRDDDATHETDALERLLSASSQARAPVALAVIPRDADDRLRQRLVHAPTASVLQHGWGHDNHAPDDQRKEEYGPHRPREQMLRELAEGWRRIAAFDRSLPVLVAPWNRMDAELVPYLPDAGLSGVSTLGPRQAGEPVPGVRCTNVHVDIIQWEEHRFIGDDAALDQVLGHLTARRQGQVDATEPTGLMTHHLVHDDGCWGFLSRFLSETASHPAVRWLSPREAFWP